jgi:hypothetical protein
MPDIFKVFKMELVEKTEIFEQSVQNTKKVIESGDVDKSRRAYKDT